MKSIFPTNFHNVRIRIPRNSTSHFCFRETLRNKSITVYVSKNDALPAIIINGDSSPASAFSLIAALWFLSASSNIDLWFERAESSRNIDAAPTRGGTLSFTVRDAAPRPHVPLSAPTLEELRHRDPSRPTSA